MAEGGDRAIELLADRPKRLAVVDSNPAQRRLFELKLAGLKALAHAEYLELIGRRPSRRRRMLYPRVRWLLSPEADEFWLARIGLIDRGLPGQGLLERHLLAFRRWAGLLRGRSFLWRNLGGWLSRRWFGRPLELSERMLDEGPPMVPAPPIEPEVFAAAKEAANRALLVEESPADYLRALPPQSVDVFILGRMDLTGLREDLRRVSVAEGMPL